MVIKNGGNLWSWINLIWEYCLEKGKKGKRKKVSVFSKMKAIYRKKQPGK